MNPLEKLINCKPPISLKHRLVSNYLDAWPESVITVNAKEAIIYESSGEINQLKTSNILGAFLSNNLITRWKSSHCRKPGLFIERDTPTSVPKST